MTRLLEQAFATVSELPDERQDEVARMLLDFVRAEQSIYVLSPEEEADLDAGLADAEAGRFASDNFLRDLAAKYER